MKTLRLNLIQNKIIFTPAQRYLVIFNVKFPLLCLLHFLSDLKSTITFWVHQYYFRRIVI